MKLGSISFQNPWKNEHLDDLHQTQCLKRKSCNDIEHLSTSSEVKGHTGAGVQEEGDRDFPLLLCARSVKSPTYFALIKMNKETPARLRCFILSVKAPISIQCACSRKDL